MALAPGPVVISQGAAPGEHHLAARRREVHGEEREGSVLLRFDEGLRLVPRQVLEHEAYSFGLLGVEDDGAYSFCPSAEVGGAICGVVEPSGFGIDSGFGMAAKDERIACQSILPVP